MITKLKNLLGIERRSIANPSAELLSLFGAVPSAAGVAVNADSALRSPTTLAAVRVIAETMGSLPIHLFRRDANGGKRRETDHPVARLLTGDWTPWAGGAESRTALQFDALLHGAAFGQVIRLNGRPREIHRLDPRSVTRDFSGSEPMFRVRDGASEKLVSWRDMVYVATPGAAPGRELCLINLARDAIGLDIAMAEHQAKLFANGARPAGVLKTAKKITIEALERLRSSLDSNYAGAGNSGRTMVLEDGLEFEALQFSSVDSQFIESRRFVISQIAGAFKTPETLLGSLDRAVWKNVEELARQFIQMCLLPWAEVWQSALERVLLTPDERETLFIEVLFDDLIRGDIAARHTAYRQACGGAWLTRNEIRALDNRPPIPGGDELVLQAGQDGGNTDPQGVPK